MLTNQLFVDGDEPILFYYGMFFMKNSLNNK